MGPQPRRKADRRCHIPMVINKKTKIHCFLIILFDFYAGFFLDCREFGFSSYYESLLDEFSSSFSFCSSVSGQINWFFISFNFYLFESKLEAISLIISVSSKFFRCLDYPFLFSSFFNSAKFIIKQNWN